MSFSILERQDLLLLRFVFEEKAEGNKNTTRMIDVHSDKLLCYLFPKLHIVCFYKFNYK